MQNNIKLLKINNFKKKIREKFLSLQIIDILHGEERISDNEFCKEAMNNLNASKELFYFYNKNHQIYEYEDERFKEAQLFFQNSFSLFTENDIVIISTDYYDEEFGVKCPFVSFCNNYSLFSSMKLPRLIINEQHTVFLALLRAEYCYEVICWKKS